MLRFASDMIDKDPALWMNMAVALGIGLLMGAERERDQQASGASHMGGIRTFALACMLGLVTAFFHFWLWILAIVAVLVLTTVSYQKLAPQHLGITTEIALIFAVILGGMCVNAPEFAAMIAIVLVCLLASKASLHQFVLNTMTRMELNHLLLLAAASLIVYPLLPDRMLGPYDAINPSALWGIVIIVMAVSAFSHVLMRVFGSRLGLPMTGLLSGFISSIATVASMASRAQATPTFIHGAIAGATWSSLATVLELALVLSIVNTETLWAIRYPLLMAGLAISLISLYFSFQHVGGADPPLIEQQTGASFQAALSLAGLIALVQISTAALKASLGIRGIYTLNALAGLIDVHAPTIGLASMVSHAQLQPAQAVFAILLAFSMNALSKLGVAYLSRQRAFYLPVTLAILCQVSMMWITWWVTR